MFFLVFILAIPTGRLQGMFRIVQGLDKKFSGNLLKITFYFSFQYFASFYLCIALVIACFQQGCHENFKLPGKYIQSVEREMSSKEVLLVPFSIFFLLK